MILPLFVAIEGLFLSSWHQKNQKVLKCANKINTESKETRKTVLQIVFWGSATGAESQYRLSFNQGISIPRTFLTTGAMS